MEQQLGKAPLVPVRPLVSASPVEHLGVEQGGVADSQLQVTKATGAEAMFLFLFSRAWPTVLLGRWYW